MGTFLARDSDLAVARSGLGTASQSLEARDMAPAFESRRAFRAAAEQTKRRQWALFFCSAAWTRTRDPPVNSGTLYQLSYRGMFSQTSETKAILADF
jgi:hypothetical protein